MSETCRYCGRTEGLRWDMGHWRCNKPEDCRQFLAERVESLQDRLENALEIVHDEKRLAALNEKLAAMRAKGLLVPYPLCTLQERVEHAEAKVESLTRKLDALREVVAHLSACKDQHEEDWALLFAKAERRGKLLERWLSSDMSPAPVHLQLIRETEEELKK